MDYQVVEQRIFLLGLPVELLYEIQLFALSEHLPLTCRHMHSVFKSASPSIHAAYLLGRILQSFGGSSPPRPVTKALRYPICNPSVLALLLRIGFGLPPEPAPELPRRLFRPLAPRTPSDLPWTARDSPLPFLRALYSPDSGIPPPDPDAHDGYALARASFAGAYPLVRFLLAKGAQPARKDGLAVLVAIRRKDLPLVRMLVERDYVMPSEAATPTRKRRLGALPSAADPVDKYPAAWDDGARVGSKRRRLQDRLQVTKDMLRTAVKCNARDIVDYLAKEKGCVPDMQTLRMLRS